MKVQTTLVLEKGRGMLWVACFPADGAQMGRNAKAERAPPDGFLMASVVSLKGAPIRRHMLRWSCFGDEDRGRSGGYPAVTTPAVTVGRDFLSAGLFLLLSVGADGFARNGDLHAGSHFDGEGVLLFVDALDGAVDTTDGHDVLTNGERLAEFIDLLALLVLRTDHEEINDGEKHHHHDDHLHTATLGVLSL